MQQYINSKNWDQLLGHDLLEVALFSKCLAIGSLEFWGLTCHKPKVSQNKHTHTHTLDKTSHASFTFLFPFIIAIKCTCQRKSFLQMSVPLKQKRNLSLMCGQLLLFSKRHIRTVVADISCASSKLHFPFRMTCHYLGSIFSPKGTVISFMFLVYIYWRKVTRTVCGSCKLC